MCSAIAENGCENDAAQASSCESVRIPQCSIDVPSVSCRNTTVFGNVARASSPCLKRHSQDGYATFSAAGNTSTVNAKGSYSVIDGSTPMKNSAVTNSELFYHRSLTVNQNTIALSSDRGSLEIAGVSLLYEGSRVKSYLLGRDLNPMGRGDGSLYAQGMFSVGNTRPMPNATPLFGCGNSINNGCGCGGDKPCFHKVITFDPDTTAKTTSATTVDWIPWNPPYYPDEPGLIPCPDGLLAPHYECCWVWYPGWKHGCPVGSKFECRKITYIDSSTCWYCHCYPTGDFSIASPKPPYPINPTPGPGSGSDGKTDEGNNNGNGSVSPDESNQACADALNAISEHNRVINLVTTWPRWLSVLKPQCMQGCGDFKFGTDMCEENKLAKNRDMQVHSIFKCCSECCIGNFMPLPKLPKPWDRYYDYGTCGALCSGLVAQGAALLNLAYESCCVETDNVY